MLFVSLQRRSFVRRIFLGSALATTGAGAWLSHSTSWTARFFRDRFAEVGRVVPQPSHKPEPNQWSDNAITLAWLGHSTLLINFYGVRILTDPVFFPRIGVNALVGTLGPKRLVSCAMTHQELPEIDLVLVSHAHFDHLDIPSLAAIRGKPIAIAASATSDLIPRKRYSQISELPWGQIFKAATPRGEVQVRAIEVKHWGARVRRDTYRGYTGFIIEREGQKLLFGGDTANTSLFEGYRNYGPFAAAMMPIGAYRPWIRSHCTPEQAIAMADAAGAKLFVPIHHQAFRLSSEPTKEPIERAQIALEKEAGRLALTEIGQTAVIAGAGSGRSWQSVEKVGDDVRSL